VVPAETLTCWWPTRMPTKRGLGRQTIATRWWPSRSTWPLDFSNKFGAALRLQPVDDWKTRFSESADRTGRGRRVCWSKKQPGNVCRDPTRSATEGGMAFSRAAGPLVSRFLAAQPGTGPRQAEKRPAKEDDRVRRRPTHPAEHPGRVVSPDDEHASPPPGTIPCAVAGLLQRPAALAGLHHRLPHDQHVAACPTPVGPCGSPARRLRPCAPSLGAYEQQRRVPPGRESAPAACGRQQACCRDRFDRRSRPRSLAFRRRNAPRRATRTTAARRGSWSLAAHASSSPTTWPVTTVRDPRWPAGRRDRS